MSPHSSKARLVLAFSLISLQVSGCSHGPRLRMAGPPPPKALSLVKAARQQLHDAGDPQRARALAQKALALDPHLAGAHAVLGELSLLTGEVEQAHAHWVAALSDGRNRRVAQQLDRIPLDYLGRNQLAGLASLLAEIVAGHPDPQSRAEALSFLIQVQLRLGDIEAATRSLARRTLIGRWYGIGGFDNEEGKGFDTPYAPEREVSLDRKYPGQRGEVGWRQIDHRGPEPAVELDEFFYPFRSNVAYLVTYVKSPRDQELVLEIVSSTPVKAWLNDRNVLANREVRGIRFRQFRVPVQLRTGFNKLLVKTCVGKSSWWLGAWLSAPDGTPRRLAISPEPRPYRRDRRPPLQWREAFALPDRAALEDGQQELSVAQALDAAGLWPSAIAAVGRHLETHPRDPVALFQAATLHQAEGQLQHASQLLELGQRLAGPYAARFWIRAASLFRSRGQHDRAFAALERARARSPGSQVLVARGLDRIYALKGWNLDRCRQATRMLERHDDWIWATSVLASCNRALGRYREEERWLQRTIQLAPADEGLRDRLVKALLRRGACAQAVAVQRATTLLRPNRAYPYLALARALRACGKHEQALEALDACSVRIPDWHKPYEVKGNILYERGRTDDALAQWELSLKHNPDHTKLWDRLTHHRPDRDPVLTEYAPSEAQIAALLAESRGVRPVEGASIIWLLDHEVSRLMPDGTLKRVVTTVRKAVDRAGRDALGQAKLPRSGLVKVLEAYTVDRRGRRREVTSMHGRTVRYPTLEEGAVVVLQYRHVRHPSGYLRHHLALSWYFQQSLEQEVRARWILAVPPERKLSLEVQGPVDHGVTRRHGLAIHTFTSEDVPPLRPEPSSPPATDLLRRVTVSTVPSWDYFTEWSRSLTAEVFAMNAELKQVLAEIVESKRTRPEQIDAIYHYALTNIRYQQDYETFLAGVKPHTASTVLARRYGDCKDKSVLMIALLRHLGIKAHLALVRTRGAGRVLAKVPSQQFNHAVVYLPPQPGIKQGRFLDATAENLDLDVLRPDVQGTTALVLFPDRYRLIPVPYQEPERSPFAMRIDLRLAADGSAAATLDLSIKGVAAGRVRKPLQNHQILHQYAQSVVHQLYPDCTLDNVRVDGHRTILKPLRVELKASCAGAARVDGDTLRLRLPRLLALITGPARWTERKHPLFLGPLELVTAEVSVRPPPGLELRGHPQPIAVKDPCIEASGTVNPLPDGGARYVQRFRRSCAELPAAGYPAFRAALNRLKRYLDEEEVVLAPPAKKPRGGPARRPKVRDR